MLRSVNHKHLSHDREPTHKSLVSVISVVLLAVVTANTAQAQTLTDVITSIIRNCPDAQNSSPFCTTLKSVDPASYQGLHVGNVTAPGTLMTTFQPSPLSSRLLTLNAGNSGMIVVDINGTGFKTPIRLAALDPSAAGDSAASEASGYDRLTIYLNGTGSFGSRETTSNGTDIKGEVGFNTTTKGVNAGVEYRFTDNLICGLASGYDWTDADLHGGAGKLNIDGYNVSLYGTYYREGWYVDAAGGFGQSYLDQQRIFSVERIGAPPPVTGTARSSFDSWQYSLSVGTGYDFTRGALTVEPYARVNYLKTHLDGYTEDVTGTGSSTTAEASLFGFTVDSQNVTSLVSDIGGRASYSLRTAAGDFVPYLQLGWEHEYENDSREIDQHFTQAHYMNTVPSRTDSPDRNYFNLGAGITATFAHGIAAFLSYDMPLGLAHVDNHTIKGGLKFQM